MAATSEKRLYLSVFLAGEVEVLVLDAEMPDVRSNGALVALAVVELLDEFPQLMAKGLYELSTSIRCEALVGGLTNFEEQILSK